MVQPFRQFHLAEADRRRIAGEGQLVPVQVVTVLQCPVDLDGLTRIRGGIAERLLRPQDVLVLGAGRPRQQQARGHRQESTFD